MKAFESKLRDGRETAPNSEARRTMMASTGQVGAITEEEGEEGLSGSNKYGLSRYQYNETLRGKMELRLNHHIDF